MTVEKIKGSISYCGLICCLCSPDGSCDCRKDNHCGKKVSPEGCYQRKDVEVYTLRPIQTE